MASLHLVRHLNPLVSELSTVAYLEQNRSLPMLQECQRLSPVFPLSFQCSKLAPKTFKMDCLENLTLLVFLCYHTDRHCWPKFCGKQRKEALL